MEKKNGQNYDNSNDFLDSLLQVSSSEKEENKDTTILEKLPDKKLNVDPLKEIPTPQMRLFGFQGVFQSDFFDTEEELIEYAKNNNTAFKGVCIIEYLGNVAGRSNVIREIDPNGRKTLYTVVDEDGYGVYNSEKSAHKGEFVWEYHHGEIREMYSAFRNRGIKFEDDVYADIDEKEQQILRLCREKNLFGMGKDKK